ncbi:HugZ family protein [Pseudochelatococcus lubricantis]|uniref:HugZ family pyridoxamine 5'-phosphate oxidase n=1 Tax=Pseudochelatococcus lubricantis TaxID=1538102 RepID=UPI0035ECDF12
MTNAPETPITPRELPIDEAAALPFDAVRTARTLLHTVRRTSVATIDPGSGYPFALVTNLTVLPDGAPCFFAAGISLQARNFETDDRAAVSLAPEEAGDALVLPRLTLVGRVSRITGDAYEVARRRYLARHPKSAVYLGLPDARLYRLTVESLKLNAGPARNAAQVSPADLVIDPAGAEALLDAEEAEIARLDALPGEAARLAGLAGADVSAASARRWRVSGIDPDGLDVVSREATARLWFPFRVERPGQLREALECFCMRKTLAHPSRS